MSPPFVNFASSSARERNVGEPLPFAAPARGCRDRRPGADQRQLLILVGRAGAADADRADDLAVDLDRDPSLQRNGPGEMERRGPAAGGLVLEVLARPPVDRRRARLVGGDADARDLRRVGAPEVDEGAARVDDGDHRRHAALRRRGAGSLGDEPGALLGQLRALGEAERGCRAGERDALVLVRRLAARPDRADDLAVDDEGDAAGERGGPVEGERAEASVGDLLLDLAARSDEDRRRPRLVERDARARDLRPRRPAELDQLAGRVDDGDDDAQAVRGRVGGCGGDDRVGARVIEDAASSGDGHGSGSFRLQGDGRDGRVRGDVEDVAAGAAEGEVDGTGEGDLADQCAVGGVDADPGRGGAVDVAVRVDGEAVGVLGCSLGDDPTVAEPRARGDVEREQVMRGVRCRTRKGFSRRARRRARWACRSQPRRAVSRRSRGRGGRPSRERPAPGGSPGGGRSSGR